MDTNNATLAVMNCISILMYHQVGKFPRVREHRANYCDYGRFQRQMAYLDLLGYHVLDMEQVLACLRGDMAIPPRSVVLTFDDGYANFYDYAFPVLQRHGFPAIVYMVADMIDAKAAWMKQVTPLEAPPLMSLQQLQAISKQGITIGSHTLNHVRLAELEDDEQKKEISQSKARLENLLQQEVRHFCYPYGSFNQDTVRLAREAGYDSAVTCMRGGMNLEDDAFLLPRKAISFGDTLPGFIWKLEMKNAPKPDLQTWRNTANQQHPETH